MRNDFNKETEVVAFERYDKKKKKNVIIEFPVVGGRLRLFHLDLEKSDSSIVAGGIKTEIVKYADNVAVVKASASVNGNSFSGIGMASKSRDSMIYPAILEMAETRAIARALRFAGYGVEYTGAEEMGGMNLADGAEGSGDNKPSGMDEKKPKAQEDPEVSLKRKVWDYVTGYYGSESKEDLAKGIKKFIKNTLSRQPEGTDDDFVYDAILNHKEQFVRAFDKILCDYPPEPDGEPRPNKPSRDEKKEIRQKFEEAKEEMANEKRVDQPVDLKEERQLQAKVFMGLPEGTNVNTFNESVKYLLSCNEGETKVSLYKIILDDMDEFVRIMQKFEEDSKAIKPEVVEEAPPEIEEGNYSDFKKKWVNLGWERFNIFIIKNAKEFKSDETMYNSAVEKFDRLKVKNDSSDMKFPYLFGDPEKKQSKLDGSKSILSDDLGLSDLELGAYISQIQTNFPSMFEYAADKVGYDKTQPYQTSEMKKAVVDCFDRAVEIWQEENSIPYTEE